jgi:hypothetical protein
VPPSIPADDYKVRILEASLKTSNDGKTKFINYTVAVLEGPEAGKRIFGTWFLTDDNIWKMKRDFNRMQYFPVGGVPSLKDLVGMEGTAAIAELDRKNPETKKRDPAMGKENTVSAWKAA